MLEQEDMTATAAMPFRDDDGAIRDAFLDSVREAIETQGRRRLARARRRTA